MTEAPLDEDDENPPQVVSPTRLKREVVEKRSMGATIGPRSKVCLEFYYRTLPLLTNKRVEEVP